MRSAAHPSRTRPVAKFTQATYTCLRGPLLRIEEQRISIQLFDRHRDPLATPTHMVASASLPPRFSMPWTAVSASRAPLIPNG